MPPTRKTSGSGRQATLSFNHRVTKPSATKLSAKEAVLDKATKAVGRGKTDKPEDRKAAADPAEEDDTVAAAKAKAEAVRLETEDAAPDDEAQDTAESGRTAPTTPTITPAEQAAAQAASAVTDAQVRRYWRAIESQATARRVHQEGLDLGEKILRYFDVSSQYGPCTGIMRKKRWLRAARLGLDPPIEVLAVLLQEEVKGTANVDRSTFDAILNPEVIA